MAICSQLANYPSGETLRSSSVVLNWQSTSQEESRPFEHEFMPVLLVRLPADVACSTVEAFMALLMSMAYASIN